jgi:aspartate aminotransferase
MAIAKNKKLWRISRRAVEVQESPIRKLIPYAEAAKAKGIHVYHLNIGQPDIETPPEFWDAIRNYPNKVLEYGHSQGQASYRKILSDYYKRNNLDIEPENIIVTTGGSEAIVFAFLLIAEPGDNVIVFEPFYTNYNGFSTQAGIEFVPVTTRVETGYHLPDRDTIENAINSKTRGIMICNPNNPTGALFSRDEMEMVVNIARDNGLYVLSDEVYREFVFEGQHVSVFDFPDVDDFAIMMDSISKRFSACGARIGNLVSRNKDFIAAALKFGQARLCSPPLEQAGAEAVYSKLGDDYFKKVMGEYKKRRDVVYEGLINIEGTVCLKASGAFYAMAKLPVDSAENFAKFMLADFSVDSKTVMVSPGPGFYATPGKGIDECRIAYVLNVDDLKDAMRILKLGVEAFNNR